MSAMIAGVCLWCMIWMAVNHIDEVPYLRDYVSLSQLKDWIAKHPQASAHHHGDGEYSVARNFFTGFYRVQSGRNSSQRRGDLGSNSFPEHLDTGLSKLKSAKANLSRR